MVFAFQGPLCWLCLESRGGRKRAKFFSISGFRLYNSMYKIFWTKSLLLIRVVTQKKRKQNKTVVVVNTCAEL